MEEKPKIIIIQTICIFIILIVLAFLFIQKIENDSKQYNLPPYDEDVEKAKNNKSSSFLKNKDGYKIIVINSEFTGQGNGGQKYSLLASKAAKNFEGLYKIKGVQGSYSDFLNISAKSGMIDEKNKHALLNNEVKVKYYDYLIKSKNVHINLANGEVYNNQGIMMDYHDSVIKANGFKANKSSIILKGDVAASFKVSSL